MKTIKTAIKIALNILFYGWLLIQIGDHTNTVGIQILCLIVLVVVGLADLMLTRRNI